MMRPYRFPALQYLTPRHQARQWNTASISLNVVEIVVIIISTLINVVKEIISIFLLFCVFLRTLFVDSARSRESKSGTLF